MGRGKRIKVRKGARKGKYVKARGKRKYVSKNLPKGTYVKKPKQTGFTL